MALDLVKGDLNEIREMALNIPQSPGTNAIAYRSPLSSGNTEGAIPFKVNNEKVFLDSWFTCLARNYEIAITPEQLLAFHSVYSANRVVMTDRNLLSAWLDCLGWKRFVKHIVASPLWSKEEDWREGAEFVFEDRKDKLTPRILIIHNFDIGILDCYLSPTLLLWSLKARSSELTKIFLIPAESAIPSLTTALMEHAAKVDIHDIAPTTKLRVEGSHWQVQLSRGTLQMGVEPKIWLQWSKSETKSNFDLKSLEKPLSLNFGDFAAANFFATANLARKFLDEDSAAGVAMHHNLLPWLMSKFPESEFDAKRRLLYDFPNLRY